jgi:protein associated with RNAse G/E
VLQDEVRVVCRFRADQRVKLLDEDEFAEHQIHYRYPTEVITCAMEAADWLYAALANGAEPFAGGYRPWLAQVT